MFEKLSFLQDRFDELSAAISDPEVIADQNKFRELCKEHSDIAPIVEKYNMYKAARRQLDEAKEMLADNPDKELKELI